MSRPAIGIALGALFIVSTATGFYLVGGQDEKVTESATSPLLYDIDRDPDVPELPFDDNPDPSQCGIPVQWGDVDNAAWLSGLWDGQLIQPEVFLYDSHLRQSVIGSARHGTQVEIVLYQENPVLDYYMVRIREGSSQRGWIPEPFLSFEPVT